MLGTGDTALLRCITAKEAPAEAVAATAAVLLAPLRGAEHAANRRVFVELANAERPEETPLLAAARLGRAAVVSSLLEAGADVGATDKQGNTVLHLAAGCADHGAAVVMAEVLLGRGGPVAGAALLRTTVKARGTTALMVAAGEGNMALLKLLLDQPAADAAHVDQRDQDGRSSMHHAAMASPPEGNDHAHTNLEMLKLLIAAGGDVHAKDNRGAHPTAKAKRLPAKLRTKYGLQRWVSGIPNHRFTTKGKPKPKDEL